MAHPRPAASVSLKQLETRAECEACVRLQHEVWGQDFVDVVPATILMVSQRVGGVAAGAFDETGHLLGFVFGISGVQNGELAHWSDMLAVRPDARRQGLGHRLKLYQRELLLGAGIQVAQWSFDPLVATNAHFNINVLGALPIEYVVDMYGNTRSPLHRGLETDRLIVEWRLTDEHPLAGASRAVSEAVEVERAPIANPSPVAGSPPDPTAPLPTGPIVRIAVPAEIDQIRSTTGPAAKDWQASVRRAFEWYLAKGYEVVGFHGAATDEAGAPWYALGHPGQHGQKS